VQLSLALALLQEPALEHQLLAQQRQQVQQVAELAPLKALKPELHVQVMLLLQAVEVGSQVVVRLEWFPGQRLRAERAWVQTGVLCQLHLLRPGQQTPPPTDASAPLH
jgi:hypothetical protein